MTLISSSSSPPTILSHVGDGVIINFFFKYLVFSNTVAKETLVVFSIVVLVASLSALPQGHDGLE
jgi:hypothetical protein